MVGATGYDDRPMTIGEHLEELRWHVLKALGWVLLALIGCLYFQERIMVVALWPHRDMAEKQLEAARTREAQEFLDSQVVKNAVRAGVADEALAKGLDDVDRFRAIVRERARPSLGELRRLRETQDGLVQRLETLRGRYEAEAKADPPDAARVADLERQRAGLAAEVEAARAEAARIARPLLDPRALGAKQTLTSLRPQDMFMAYFKLAIVAALFVASPLVARQLWLFVASGLYAHEKKWVHLFAPLSYLTFIVGFLFGYLVMIPFGLSFLASYGPTDMFEVQYSIDGYLSMFIGLSLLSGVIFELPLAMTFLTLLGFVSPQKFAEWRRYWILVAAIISAILTPPDGVTMILMGIPLLGLYELGILLGRLVRPEQAEPPPPDPAPPAPERQLSYAERYPETPVVEAPPAAPARAEPAPAAEPSPASSTFDPTRARPAPEGTVAAGHAPGRFAAEVLGPGRGGPAAPAPSGPCDTDPTNDEGTPPA